MAFFTPIPMPATFVVMPDEVIAMMDFGIMGHLDAVERLGLVQLFVGLFRQDTDRVVEAMADLGIATRAADRRNLARDLDRLRMRYYGLDLERIRARSFVEDLMGLAFANRLKMPSNLVLVFKSHCHAGRDQPAARSRYQCIQRGRTVRARRALELQSPITRAKELC